MKKTFVRLLVVEILILLVIVGLFLYASMKPQVLGVSTPRPEVSWCIYQNDNTSSCFKPTPILPNETAFTSFLRLAQFENIPYSTITDGTERLTSVQTQRVSPDSAWTLYVGDKNNQGIERDLYTYVPRPNEELTLRIQNEISGQL